MYDHTTTIASIPSHTPGIRLFTLQHRPAQVDFYGKSISEAWGAIFIEYSGTTNGKWYASEQDARAKFATWQQREGR